MKRQWASKLVGVSVAVLVAAGSLASCGGGGGEGSAGSNTLRVTLANHVWTETIKTKIPEFEKQSGLKVELTQLGEDQLSDQYNVKLNAGSDEIDVMMYRPLQEGKLFAQNKYLAQLTDKVKGNAEWQWADFQPGPVNSTTYEDQVVGVPIITEQEVLYYRADLLKKAGLKAPATLAELEQAAKTISAANPGVAGFVARTGKSAAVTQFSSFLFSFGGDFVDTEGKASVNTPEAKKAYAYYGGLIKNYGPKNVSTDMSWPEAAAIFAQGKAAFYTDASSLYKNLTEAKNSTVSDQVGFAPFPKGAAGSKPYNVPSWALGVNEATAQQDNAWKFIEWATSKAMVLDIQKAGVPGPRDSVWADPTGTSGFPKQLASAITVSSKNGVGHDRPVVSSVAEAREIVGEPIVSAITGQQSDAAADKANTAFQALLDKEK